MIGSHRLSSSVTASARMTVTESSVNRSGIAVNAPTEIGTRRGATAIVAGVASAAGAESAAGAVTAGGGMSDDNKFFNNKKNEENFQVSRKQLQSVFTQTLSPSFSSFFSPHRYLSVTILFCWFSSQILIHSFAHHYHWLIDITFIGRSQKK